MMQPLRINLLWCVYRFALQVDQKLPSSYMRRLIFEGVFFLFKVKGRLTRQVILYAMIYGNQALFADSISSQYLS